MIVQNSKSRCQTMFPLEKTNFTKSIVAVFLHHTKSVNSIVVLTVSYINEEILIKVLQEFG